MSIPEDYYQRLQVSPQASQTEIKAAFRRLARQYHPDLNPQDPAAQEKFRTLVEAYEVLIDTVQRQQYDRAKNPDQMRQAVDLPRTPQEFYLQGIYQTLARQYALALSSFDQAIAQQSDFFEAYLRRAQVRYVLGDDAGVLADCQRALELDNQQSTIYYYQGLSRQRLGYTQSAVAAFTQAIGLEADEPQSYYQRALAYLDLGEEAFAKADLIQAATLYEAQGDLTQQQQMNTLLKQVLGHVAMPPPLKVSLRQPIHWQMYWQIGSQIRSPKHFFDTLFNLLSNPTGELLPIYARLSSRQATNVGHLWAFIANVGFTLGGYELVGATDAPIMLLWLWLTGSLVFLVLLVLLAFCRTWFHRARHHFAAQPTGQGWAADSFIAGATVLPLGILALLTPVTLGLSRGLWGLIGFFAITHTVLTLCTGLVQIQNQRELVATWIAPCLLFMSLSAVFILWARM
jgi:curved DNA-binding protein CbpA